MLIKIYYTTILVSFLLFALSFILSISDWKREEIWKLIAKTSFILLILVVAGGALYAIWTK